MDRFAELARRWDAEVSTLPDAVVRIAEDIGGDDTERMQIADALMAQQATIDTLVAALRLARSRLDPYAESDSLMQQIDAALALARGGK